MPTRESEIEKFTRDFLATSNSHGGSASARGRDLNYKGSVRRALPQRQSEINNNNNNNNNNDGKTVERKKKNSITDIRIQKIPRVWYEIGVWTFT